MFSKILKYDMKAVWKIWRIITPIIILIGLSMIIDGRVLTQSEITRTQLGKAGGLSTSESLTEFLLIAWLLIGFIAISVYLVITPVLCIKRYYTNFFTDEGYLTFTLPVSRAKLYLSKCVSYFIWQAATTAVFILLLLLALLFVPGTQNGELINPVCYDTIKKSIIDPIADSVGKVWYLYLFELILIFASLSVTSLGFIQFCFTLGATIVKKNKILAALGICYGTSVIISFIMQLIFNLTFMTSGATILNNIGNFTPDQSTVFVALILGLIFTVVSLIGVFIHTLTVNTIERKLNLA